MLVDGPSRAELEALNLAESFRDFVRAAWKVVEPATPPVFGWHVDAICDHLEAVTAGQIKDLVINVPPRHTKSTLVSVMWPTWEWTRNPSQTFLTASYALKLAIRDAVASRRLIESPWYKERWGHLFKLADDQNAKSRYDNDRRGWRIATSVDSSAIGDGGDRIIVDDPHSATGVESDAKRETALEWWRSTMSTRRNNPRIAARVIVMQRLHERDLSAEALSTGTWEHLCLPAEYEGDKRKTSIGWSDPRTERGDLLCPERFDREAIEELKVSLGSYAAAGQLQQRPAPAGGGRIKRYWFRFWYPKDIDPPEPHRERGPDGLEVACPQAVLPDRFDFIGQSWDMAFKGENESDFVCGQTWGKLQARKYLLDMKLDKLDFPATLREVAAMRARWPRTMAIWVEDKANGPAVMSTLRGKVPGLVPVEPDGGKVARVNAAAPTVEAGDVWLPHPSIAPWVKNLLASLSAFPKGAYDDDVDAFTQAIRKMDSMAVADFNPAAMLGVGQRANPWRT